MAIQEQAAHSHKKEGAVQFANLPADLQLKIRHYLELGDFRAAKALYDRGRETQD
jgi:hypothetical protein